MKNTKKRDKKLSEDTENLVANTRGGEMPDPDQKVTQKASDAAKIFENSKGSKNNDDRDKKIRDQMVVDDDDINDQDTELDVEKKAS